MLERESATPAPVRVTEKKERAEPESLKMVRPRKSARRAAVVVTLLFITIVLILTFVPWQQTVVGSGEVIVYSAMDRPQSVEAPIPGRIADWKVQEGDLVQKGDVIARLQDIDSKFLDKNQVSRLREQRDFARQTREESAQRVTELASQKGELSVSRQNAIDAARQAILQAEQREIAQRQVVRQTEQSLKIARQVAIASAQVRASQAQDRVVQAEQILQAAKQQAETMRLRKARIADLEGQGLRSRQDLELAQNDLVKAETEVTRGEKALEIARRDVSVGNLGEEQAGLETERAQAALEQARANLEVAERDVINARLNLTRVINDTAAAISRVGADIQSARESLAKNGGDIQKVENDLANLTVRTEQQVVRAPATGRIARLMKVGEGTMVKAGDELAVIVPDTADRAVELYVTDNDVPLLQIGRPVRLQFAGWPALQFSGMPSVAVGTFGGRVAVIDPVDDGTARYRVIVRPDRHILPSGRKDPAWPDSKLLRPGAEAAGWVMLDTVPLGFELWRQFNGFPARAPKGPVLGSKKAAAEEKKKDRDLGPIKLKSK